MSHLYLVILLGISLDYDSLNQCSSELLETAMPFLMFSTLSCSGTGHRSAVTHMENSILWELEV